MNNTETAMKLHAFRRNAMKHANADARMANATSSLLPTKLRIAFIIKTFFLPRQSYAGFGQSEATLGNRLEYKLDLRQNRTYSHTIYCAGGEPAAFFKTIGCNHGDKAYGEAES